jgi:hypothetical protein
LFDGIGEQAASRRKRAALAPTVTVVEDADDEPVLDFHGKPDPSKADAMAFSVMQAGIQSAPATHPHQNGHLLPVRVGDTHRSELPMDFVNRSALVVRPKRRFMEWANMIQPDGPRLQLEELPGRAEIYLIDGNAMSDDTQVLIDAYSEDIWDQQLSAWWTDEAVWPPNRTPHTLRDWFDIQLIDVVFDADPDQPFHDEDADVVADALSYCAWCNDWLEEDDERITLSLTISSADPLLTSGLTVITLPVAGEERLALLAQPDSDMARDGKHIAFTCCSEECATALREAYSAEHGAALP